MTPSLTNIRKRLTAHSFDDRIEGTVRRAAVAAILREIDQETEILLIKRAEKSGDPWSGQMAFPGGHLDPGDPSARHAAERETLEEIGLDLTQHGRFMGALEPQCPLTRVSERSVAVAPFVYELTSEPDHYGLGNEVAEIHWVRIGPMLRRENLSHVELVLGGEPRSLPGYDISGRIVWGITFRMLNRLFSLIDPEFQPLD